LYSRTMTSDEPATRGQRGQMVTPGWVRALTLVIVVVGLGVAAQPAIEDGLEYTENAAEWCEEHGGELNNARVIGEHGGLHCEFGNGTSVHVDEVNASDEW